MNAELISRPAHATHTIPTAAGVRSASAGPTAILFRRVITMSLALLALVIAVSLIGAIRIGAVQREVVKVAREIVPFSNIINHLTITELRGALEVEHALLVLERTRSDEIRADEIARLKHVLVENEKSSFSSHLAKNQLLTFVDDQERDEFAHPELATRIRKSLRSIQSDSAAYQQELRAAIEKLEGATAPPYPSLGQAIAELQRIHLHIDLHTRELRQSVETMIQHAMTTSSTHQRSAEVLLASTAGLALVLGILLVWRIRALHHRMLSSERTALLARTVVTLHHEINNPLAIIVGNAELLQMQLGGEDEKRTEMLATIQQMAMRIRDVLHKLSTLAEVAFTDYVSGTSMVRIDELSDQESRASKTVANERKSSSS